MAGEVVNDHTENLRPKSCQSPQEVAKDTNRAVETMDECALACKNLDESCTDQQKIESFFQNPDLILENQEVFKSIPASEFLDRSPAELRLLFINENGEVNFYGSNTLYQAIGAGDLYENDQDFLFLRIDGVVGKRSVTANGKVGYVGENGQYLSIDGGVKKDHTKILEDVSPEEQKGFESIITLSPEKEVGFRKSFQDKIKNQENLHTHLESLSSKNEINTSFVQNLIEKYFPADVDMSEALRIVRGESASDAGRLNGIHENPGGGNDVGLWQINTKYQESLLAEMNVSPDSLYDPAVNVRVAAEVYKRAGNSWSPWIAARKMGLA